MVHRGIATLAGCQVLCFFLLAHYEPQFFLLHFYQSLVFLTIVLMLFYFEDHWAYMLGILTPAFWLVISFATGLLGAGVRQVGQLFTGEGFNNPVSLLAAITAILAVLMITACAYRWNREFSGLKMLHKVLPVSLALVILYYVILIWWFWKEMPHAVIEG